MGSSPILKRLSIALKAGLALLVLLAGFAVFGVLVASRPDPVHTERPEPVVTVRSITAALVPAPRVWEGYGSAVAMNAADVSAEVGARVIERPSSIEAGNPVRKEDVILRLDATDYEQRLASAEAKASALRAQIDGLVSVENRWREQSSLIAEEIGIQRAELERAQDAQRREAANIADIDARVGALRRLERESASIMQQVEDVPFRRAQLQAQLADQEAEARVARQDLERTRVVSPIDGVLQWVQFREGEMVPAGAPVARVVDLSRVEIPLLAPIASASELRAGDEVAVRSDSPLSPGWGGSIARVAPEADAERRTVTLFVEVMQDASADPTSLLRPGQFVVGRVTSRSSSPRLVVPRRAIDGDRVMVGVLDPEAPGTYRVEARDAAVLYALDARYPELDAEETQWVVINGDIRPGDVVVTSNLDELHEGQRVRIGKAAGAP